MTNYYVELNLNQSLGAKELQQELIRQENLWIRREVTNPEKARKMLSIIDDAKAVFASVESKANYDRQLKQNSSQKESRSVNQSVQSWMDKADEYMSQTMYDLAKEAIDRAISSGCGQEENSELYCKAADVYLKNKIDAQAMVYINNAIVLSPENAYYYIIKALIYEDMSNQPNYDYQNQFNNLRLAKEMLKIADEKARLSQDAFSEAVANGIWAFLLWNREPSDHSLAEEKANRTVALGGDPWGNADKIIKKIEEEKAQNEHQYQNAKALMQEEKYREALLEFEELVDYKDSSKYEEICHEKIKKQEEIEKEKQIKAAEEANRIRRKEEQQKNNKYTFGIVGCLIGMTICFATKMYFGGAILIGLTTYLIIKKLR